MMFEVCRSRALEETNFFRAFLHATAVWHKLIWEKAITKERIAILMKETKINTSSLSLTLQPGNKSLVRLITFFFQNKRWAELNNNLDFDDFSQELSVS